MSPISKNEHFDVIVIGCGPAGSILAANLAKQGISVLALERHPFPRYHIGESLSGPVGDYIREIGLSEEMEKLKFLQKTGVKYISNKEHFIPTLAPTWQVRRSEFDKLLLDYAIKNGVTHRYGSVKKIFRANNKVIGVGYKPVGSNTDLLTQIHCKIVADASGHTSVLSKHRVAGRRKADSIWRWISAFTQVKGAVRDHGEMGNNTFIYMSESNHWAWFVPLSEDLVSVGVVAPISTVKNNCETEEDLLEWGFKNIHPAFTAKVSNCEIVEPIRVINSYAYHIEPFAGDGWLCVGDSHQFTDPICSVGISTAMNEAKAASNAILQALKQNDSSKAFADYVDFCRKAWQGLSSFPAYLWNFGRVLDLQSRGKLRKDIIRMFDGDFFTSDKLTAMAAMRNSIYSMLPAEIPDGTPREIAGRVQLACWQGIDAAFLETNNEKILLSLLLDSEDLDLREAISDFEESLYSDFGRQNLIINHYLPSEPIISTNNTHVIFDKRKKE